MKEEIAPENKCVLVIDENLPLGVIANTAAILSMSIGKSYPDLVGFELADNDGFIRAGITTRAIPILKGDGRLLKKIRPQLKEFEPDLFVVDLIGATKTTKSYEEYADQLIQTPEEKLEYFGIGLFGAKKLVNKFTGSLGLLR
ncbi:DUF2000 domain-containing protein [Aliikangiella coralliicola]|uniref:DUF2000 domain-containing protein n=2 Tax=Aliikangiella coralliicola TaxID=2592383 RepID=A0A545U6J6_9GAMM|nr:DUF2000 domain-containing protein [Aliikangiella coralliicola]